jgi:CMP-N-acetylneuraminic acid synthetase
LEFTFSNESSQPRQRQKLDQWFFPNGAIYLAPLKDFKGEFYSKKTQMYVMPEEYSVDIDTLEDFEKALEVKRTLSSSHEGSQ